MVERARQVSEAFNEDDRCCLIAAAYLHDIGYAPALQQTGFHPIDGAMFKVWLSECVRSVRMIVAV